MENIVETKNCQKCNVGFDITDMDLKFYDTISPIFNEEKFQVPTPKFCPKCRQQRRLSYQNMYNLYKRKCSATGKSIISIFSEDKHMQVFNLETWWGDSWSPVEMFTSFDSNFLSQFHKLLQVSPIPCLFTNYKEDVNSEFTNFAGYDKDCYMIFHADFNEDCYYATGLKNSKKCIDSLNIFDCEQTFDSINCQKSFNLQFSQDCINCADSIFLKDCIGCKKSFGCVGLKNKSYCIYNEQKTKEEYEDFIAKNSFSNYKVFKEHYDRFHKSIPNNIVKSHQGSNNVNCNGNYIFDSKNVRNSYDIAYGENMKFCERIYNGPNVDCYDVDQFGAELSRVYECSVVGVQCDSVISTIISYNASRVYYSIFTFNCKDCFGCVGLKNRQYCILNKQYTKEEYNILVPKIIENMKQTGEWGEFFPSSLSPFGYNETVAQEYFPLEKENAIAEKFNWSDYDAPLPKVDKIIPASQLPDNISDIPDDILNWAIECEVTKKPFRIIPQELEFYRTHALPIPRKHPDRRHLDRTQLRNPKKLYKRDCDKCSIEMDTTYAPEREERVYCEECYEKEMY